MLIINYASYYEEVVNNNIIIMRTWSSMSHLKKMQKIEKKQNLTALS